MPGHHARLPQGIHIVQEGAQFTLSFAVNAGDTVLAVLTGNAAMHVDFVVDPDHERLFDQPGTQLPILGKSLT